MKHHLIMVFGLLLILAAAGCADPAKDKPRAEVRAAASEPAAPAEAQRFVLTDESSIGFVGSKVTGSHDGGFNDFEGEVLLSGGDPAESSVKITIDTTSIWTDTDQLTEHLKSADFFDVETYPTSTFTSTEIVKEGEGYRITGNLSLHGITKSISFPADITIEEGRITAAAEFALKRFEYDMKYPGKADDLIRDDVVIKLTVVAEPA